MRNTTTTWNGNIWIKTDDGLLYSLFSWWMGFLKTEQKLHGSKSHSFIHYHLVIHSLQMNYDSITRHKLKENRVNSNSLWPIIRKRIIQCGESTQTIQRYDWGQSEMTRFLCVSLGLLSNTYTPDNSLTLLSGDTQRKQKRVCRWLCAVRPVEQASPLLSAASWSDEKFLSLTSHLPGDAAGAWPEHSRFHLSLNFSEPDLNSNWLAV